MVDEITVYQYLESMRGLSATDVAKKMAVLCPDCTYAIMRYLVNNPWEFESLQIAVPLYYLANICIQAWNNQN